MKNWINNHKIVIVTLLLFIVTYLIVVAICSEYIKFGYNYREKNIDIAKFYFLKLPLWSIVPSLLYLCTILVKKFIENKKDDKRISSNCLVETPYISRADSSLFYNLRESSYDKYWSVISMHIDKALEYMLTHPHEFHVGEKIIDYPNWEENSYFRETIYVNGKKLIIFMPYKTFLVNLSNCVKEITKK